MNCEHVRFLYCGLQIRPVGEQLKQRVIGERYCISKKKKKKNGSHAKEVLAVLGLQSVCQMSRKKQEVASLSEENMFRLDESIFRVW